jgi:hypothetical protein
MEFFFVPANRPLTGNGYKPIKLHTAIISLRPDTKKQPGKTRNATECLAPALQCNRYTWKTTAVVYESQNCFVTRLAQQQAANPGWHQNTLSHGGNVSYSSRYAVHWSIFLQMCKEHIICTLVYTQGNEIFWPFSQVGTVILTLLFKPQLIMTVILFFMIMIIIIIIIIIITITMVLRHSVRFWPLFQFLHPIHSR